LTSLFHGPVEVGIDYGCQINKLTSLEGAPAKIADFSCAINLLTSLQGAPKICRWFVCQRNPLLTSLEGIPQELDEITLTYTNDLPLLRLLNYDRDVLDVSTPNCPQIILQLLKKFTSRKDLRLNILACQKELIDAGFEGNASW
jgi:hypothetical protein